MKKLLAMLAVLAVMMLVAALSMLAGHAEESLRLEYYPDMETTTDPAPIRVAYILPVKLNWETVYRDETLHTYAFLPNSAESIVAVLLTDGTHFVHANLEQRGYATLHLTFPAGPVRLFLSRATYLVFVETLTGEGE